MSVFPQCDPVVRDQLAREAWDGVVPVRDGEAGRLLSRGWPHLRVIVDGPAKTAAKADNQLAAVDPQLHVIWPRPAVEPYLAGWLAAVAPAEAGATGLERVDAVLVAATSSTLRQPFHWRDALYLLEDEHGPVAMADRVLARLEALSDEQWRFDNPNNRLLVALGCLEAFLLRAGPEAAALCDRLRAIATARGPTVTMLSHRISVTITGTGNVQRLTTSYLIRERAMLDKVLAKFPSWDVDAQHVYVFGPGVLSPEVIAPMRRDPAYKRRTRAEELGVFSHPAIAATIAAQTKAAR